MRRVNFDTQLLRSLLTIVDTGSFVAAAEQLNMTQPAISQQMRRLEEQAGAPLFQRDGRKLSLATVGETLLGYACKIIALNDQIGEELGVSKQAEPVHIGMPEHFSESLLPELIHQAHASFPHLQLMIKVARSQALSDALSEGRLNMALLLGPAPSPGDKGPGDKGPGDESWQPVPLRWICGNDFPLPPPARPGAAGSVPRPLRFSQDRNQHPRTGRAVMAMRA